MPGGREKREASEKGEGAGKKNRTIGGGVRGSPSPISLRRKKSKREGKERSFHLLTLLFTYYSYNRRRGPLLFSGKSSTGHREKAYYPSYGGMRLFCGFHVEKSDILVVTEGGRGTLSRWGSRGGCWWETCHNHYITKSFQNSQGLEETLAETHTHRIMGQFRGRKLILEKNPGEMDKKRGE